MQNATWLRELAMTGEDHPAGVDDDWGDETEFPYAIGNKPPIALLNLGEASSASL